LLWPPCNGGSVSRSLVTVKRCKPVTTVTAATA
jgi:hypothetical protein